MGLLEFVKSQYIELRDGEYVATVEEIETVYTKYGEALRIQFSIDGHNTYRQMLAKKRFTPRAKLYDLLLALGFDEEDFNKLNEDDFIGKKVKLLLKTNKATGFQEIIAFDKMEG